jgi:CheY-like chemotaxis protein
VIDLGEVVRSSEKLLRRLLGANVEVVSRLAPDLWPIRIDLGLAEQVLFNLAVNAHDAMPDGGQIGIETSNVVLDQDDVIRYPGTQPGPWVRLVVRDSGAGMSSEVQAHLFEPFFTTKAVGKGTGLGLSTVYGIVVQSGGAVAVESEPRRGTSFTFHFPRTSAACSPPAPAPAPARSPGTETVLVVEDEPLVRAVTVRALASAGYRVLAAGSGAEALAVAEREPRPIGLLVSDVVMPGMSGPVLASTLGRKRPGLKVLLVSGYTRDAILERSALPPGTELLEKPFTPARLLERVRALLDTAPL